MPRPRKTSTQPKRKPKKPVKIVKPEYPDYIEEFIKEVESKTPFKVKVDQYMKENSYHIGVNEVLGKVQRCIWMVGFVIEPEQLRPFWTSKALQNVTNKTV